MSLFTSIDTGIADVFPKRDHPLRPQDPTNGEPVETNKFYGNMLLDKRTLYAFPHPFSVWWTAIDDFYGLGISHTTASQRVFGPNPNSNPASYYYNPVGIMSLCLSANQFNHTSPAFSTSQWGPLSVVAKLSLGDGQVQFPILNGMGFVTGVYSKLKPVVSSQIGIRSVDNAAVIRAGLTRQKVVLENGVTWLVYTTSPSGASVSFGKRDPNHLDASSDEDGLVVQVTTIGDDSWVSTIDSAAGAYGTGVKLTGEVNSDQTKATYRFEYAMAGSSTGGGTLIYALPHHYESFTSTMNNKVTKYKLSSTVLGDMTMCVATSLEMFEDLPKDVGFLPWNVSKPAGDNNFAHGNYSSDDLKLIAQSATNETNGDIKALTNLSSMYFSGKAMDKFALILLVVKYIVKDDNFARNLVDKLKSAFETFTKNQQQTPLAYDQLYHGLVSQAGWSDPGQDFGNTYYNDHHFHYGYFVHAAAVLGKVDAELGGSWAKDNKQWVNSLVRDVANFGDDKTFPISRSFDWFQGHSLAKGLFASGDGKDEESSSEDYHFYYGMKLWAQVIGDTSMERRADLILAIERRAMGHYMLFSSNNTTEPAQILPNRVSGIKFENKIDHTTYFGTNLEYIQGIHMIPLTPISPYVRQPQFVREEWDAVIGGLVDNVDSGWKGILQLNRAIIDPTASWSFFSQANFQNKWLDDGLSRTWALAFSKGLL
ncbi:Endo-1,3(4)-beta-glucanase 1 [Wickerhamiella sorbophila]|uniref:glucan endo-1,3-beta-D-glucosidase n=1 Tax=Wickerhamiella sorbophila TaxID=45607 RepID=A0A2T0FCA1_9ASCO|nr:Endo-1,3(4)-beta-glucanase 1 [Wickerhamiella sorbophila]PRT52633.1 Endo-1,3(4)-beta-glucanase 1 [Wickerhamiella sorbophila]